MVSDEYFNKWAEDGDIENAEMARCMYRNGTISMEEFSLAIKEHFGGDLNKVKGAKFLDAGSGIGSSLQELIIDLGGEVTSLDKSSRIVDMVRKEGREAVNGDVFFLPFDSESFDGVIQSQVIDIVPKNSSQLTKMLQEIHRVLKPEGIFVQTHHGGGFPHDWFPTFEEQIDILAEAGFKEIRLIEEEGSCGLTCIATKGEGLYTREEALLTDIAWFYRKTDRPVFRSGDRHSNHYDRVTREHPSQDNNHLQELKDSEILSSETIKKHLVLALKEQDADLLLSAIKATILSFYPEPKNDESFLETVIDFEWQFCIDVWTVPQIDFKSWGLYDILQSWRKNNPVVFTFFGRQKHDQLIFDPEQKAVIYGQEIKDKENNPYYQRFVETFDSNRIVLEYS